MILALCLIILVLIADNYDVRKRLSKRNDECYLAQEELAKVKRSVRSLLWEIGHQREKVKSHLHVLLPVLYKGNMNALHKSQIIEKVMNNIK